MNKDIKHDIPEFNYKPDYILVKLMLICFLTPLMYGVFFSYLPPFMKILWVPIAMLLAAALFVLGRITARAAAKERVPYDPVKTLRQYVRVEKSWLSFLAAVGAGVLFFFIAKGIHNWYLEDYHDGTTAHAVGYVYEAVVAVYAFFVTYFSGLLWFLHDGMVLPAGYSLSFSLVAPIAMMIIPTVFAGVPKEIAIIYTAVFIVLLVIRNVRVISYNKAVEKLERQIEEDRRRSKSKFDN